MTEKELANIYYLKREAERLAIELARLEERTAGYGISSPVMKHEAVTTGHRANITEDTAVRFVRMGEVKSGIEDNLANINAELARLNNFINAIPDAETRLIFRLRYINGCTWDDVACEIGLRGNGRRSTVQKKHRAFLKKIERG